MTEPKWLSIARGELGTREIEGPKSNSRIVEYSKIAVGTAAPDSEAWCAKFVGWALIQAGESGTGKANARSYLHWGDNIDSQPIPGCVVVFWRGSPKGWEGHVAFYIREDATHIYTLGGNQRNEVSIARYPKNQWLGYRWPSAVVKPAVVAVQSTDPSLKSTQQRLKDLGYHMVGTVDGKWGPNTRSALRAFIDDWNDRGSSSPPLIQPSTNNRADFLTESVLAALSRALPRPVAPARETADASAIADYAAVKDSNKTANLGKAGTVAGVVWAAVQSGAADQVAQASNALQTVRDAVTPFWPMLQPILPFILIAACFFAWRWARNIKREEVESHRMGETP